MNIIFLGQGYRNNLHPWYEDFVDAVAGRWPIRLFDPDQPVAPQFAGVTVVVDQGGAVGTPEMFDLAAAGGVRLWQVLGTGLDHVDVAGILRRGLTLANCPGPFSAVALAEHAIFLMMMFAKKYHQMQQSLRSRVMCLPLNEELEGKTLGLVGMGASARELARRAKALGMRILAIDVIDLDAAAQREYGLEFYGHPRDLDRLLAESDYLSLHLPLTAQTHEMIGRAQLRKMKSTAVLVNVARAEIVDEAALAEALREGWIAGAGLDVFSHEPVDPAHPLLQMPNVIATPHVAGCTMGTSRRRGWACAENAARIAQGLAPLYQVTVAD